MLEILVNNEALDLDPGEIIEFTFQVNDIGELRDQQVTFSNGFKAPNTTKNQRLLQNAQSFTSTTRILYRKTPCRVRQNNALLIPRGVLVIDNIDQSGYDLSIYWLSFDFFNTIDKLNLQELEMADLDFEYSVGGIPALMNSTTGLVYPLIDYGGDRDRFDITRQHHGTYLHTIVDRIFAGQGINKTGKVFNNPFYRQLVVPFNNDLYRTSDDVFKFNFEATTSGTQSFGDTGGSFVSVFFPNVVSNPSNSYDAVASTYTPNGIQPNAYKGKLIVELTIRKDVGTDSATVRLVAARPVSLVFPLVSVDFTENTTAATKITLEYEDIIIGYEYSVEIRTTIAGLNDIHIEDVSRYFSEVTDAAIAQGERDNVEGIFAIDPQDVSASLNLPALTQKQLIKNFYQSFGILTQYNPFTNTLHHFQFNELVENIPNADNWSDKVTSVRYQLDVPRDFAQRNELRYSPDDSLENPERGNGFFLIDDDILEDSSEAITLDFSASDDAIYLNHSSGKISRYEFDTGSNSFVTNFNNVVKILAVYDVNFGLDLFGDGSDLGFNVNPFKGTYFINRDREFNLGFDDNLISNNYTALVQSLNEAKEISLEMKLTETDLASLDFSIPKFLDVKLGDTHINGYFYVKSIEGVAPGRFPVVNLLKLQ